MSLYLGTTLISPNQPNSANQSLSNINSTAQENIVDLLYPVGSIYIGTTAECPLAAIKGTWTLQSRAIVTSVNTSVPIKGTGKTLGFTNGTSTFSLVSGSGSSYIGGDTDSFNQNTSSTATAPESLTGKYGITTDSSKSGIVGTVTRTTLSANIWERTA